MDYGIDIRVLQQYAHAGRQMPHLLSAAFWNHSGIQYNGNEPLRDGWNEAARDGGNTRGSIATFRHLHTTYVSKAVAEIGVR